MVKEFPEAGCLEKYKPDTNIFDQLWEAGNRFGVNKTAAEDLTMKVTYRELILGSYIIGRKLQNLCGEAENVGLLLPSSVGHLIALFALCREAKTPVILNFSGGLRNILDCAQLAGLRTIVSSRLFIEKAGLSELAEQLSVQYQIVYLEDVKASIGLMDKVAGLYKFFRKQKAVTRTEHHLILFTSGSESKPKGVVLRHANIMANIDQLARSIDFGIADKMFSALPMFHSFGLTGGALLPVLKGMETYLYPSPLHYKIIPELIKEKRPTILIGTPTFLMGYAKNGEKFAFQTLRYVIAGGEKLKEDIRCYWQDHFGINLMEGYGTTEASPALCISSHAANKPGSVGRFLPGIEWKLEPVEGIAKGGNLHVKGPNLMKGYLLHERGFVPLEDWYDSGDVVWVDEEGFCFITARLKRFAKLSGEMVSLNTVEEVAEQCFNTDQNAAVSVLDAKKGEKIVLFTTCKTASRQQLREYLGDKQLSMLLLATEVVILPEMPVMGTGKIDYVRLQELAGGME